MPDVLDVRAGEHHAATHALAREPLGAHPAHCNTAYVLSPEQRQLLSSTWR